MYLYLTRAAHVLRTACLWVVVSHMRCTSHTDKVHALVKCGAHYINKLPTLHLRYCVARPESV